MTLPESLQAVLAERFSALPPKQQQVARILVEDPSFVAFASAAEVAERANVDAATVVRSCQSLGYAGWTELQRQIRQDFAGRHTFAERVAALDAEHDLTGQVFATAIHNVERTLEQLDRDAFEALCRRIVTADTVLVAAGGVSQGPGQFLVSSLQLLGHHSALVTGAHDAGPALGMLGENDAVIAISVWRYLRVSVQVLAAARELGITTMAITDSVISPGAIVADHVLVASTSTVGPRLGLAGIVTLLEAVVARVATLEPERAKEGAMRANRLYYEGHVLGDEPPEGEGRPAR